VPLLQDMAHVMQSIVAHIESTHSDTSSHTLWTLDDGKMGFILTDMVMMKHLWERIPYYGQCTHTLPNYLMEDIAPSLAWKTYRDDGHPPPPCKPYFTPWMLNSFDDNIMIVLD
jgi:hypothetical protein